jgi:hypothetical protein
MKSPCANCPFRAEPRFYLIKERAIELQQVLVNEGRGFHCHKTIDYGKIDDGVVTADGCGIGERDSEHCAGAMILLQKIGKPNQPMQVCERLGLFNPLELNMDAPVYDTFEEFINGVSHP